MLCHSFWSLHFVEFKIQPRYRSSLTGAWRAHPRWILHSSKRHRCTLYDVRLDKRCLCFYLFFFVTQIIWLDEWTARQLMTSYGCGEEVQGRQNLSSVRGAGYEPGLHLPISVYYV